MGTEARPSVGDLVLGILFIGIGIAGLYDVLTDPFLDLFTGRDPGPALMPQLMLGLLILAGVVQIVTVCVRAVAASGFRSDTQFRLRTIALPASFVLTLILYATIVRWSGYLAATFVFALFWLPIIQLRNIGRPSPSIWLLMGFEAALVTGALWAVFKYLILVPLP